VPDGSAYETVGGFVMAELGRVPVIGDEVELPLWHVRVEAMDGRRVDRLRFVPSPEPAAPEAEAEAIATLLADGPASGGRS
jgi:CBS domain containing-hemolysin-like protein